MFESPHGAVAGVYRAHRCLRHRLGQAQPRLERRTPGLGDGGWLYDGFFLGGLLWFIMDNYGLLMFIMVYDSGGLPHEEVYSFYKTDWFLLWFIDVYDMG